MAFNHRLRFSIINRGSIMTPSPTERTHYILCVVGVYGLRLCCCCNILIIDGIMRKGFLVILKVYKCFDSYLLVETEVIRWLAVSSLSFLSQGLAIYHDKVTYMMNCSLLILHSVWRKVRHSYTN